LNVILFVLRVLCGFIPAGFSTCSGSRSGFCSSLYSILYLPAYPLGVTIKLMY
jgi:hypothetical protein